jgi:molybdopterin-binding protein
MCTPVFLTSSFPLPLPLPWEGKQFFPSVEEITCACIRPEDITISISQTSTSARNSFAGKIKSSVSSDALTRINIECGFPLVVLVTGRAAGEPGLEKGKQVFASFKATGVHVIKRDGDS